MIIRGGSPAGGNHVRVYCENPPKTISPRRPAAQLNTVVPEQGDSSPKKGLLIRRKLLHPNNRT